jgi:hypothetical protein
MTIKRLIELAYGGDEAWDLTPARPRRPRRAAPAPASSHAACPDCGAPGPSQSHVSLHRAHAAQAAQYRTRIRSYLTIGGPGLAAGEAAARLGVSARTVARYAAEITAGEVRDA